MIQLYRLDYINHKFEEFENFKNYILVSLKNSIWMLSDIFLINKDNVKDLVSQESKCENTKYDMEISDLTIDTIIPVVKTRISSTLFMVIFSAEIIDLVVSSKSDVNEILLAK